MLCIACSLSMDPASQTHDGGFKEKGPRAAAQRGVTSIVLPWKCLCPVIVPAPTTAS